MKQVRSRVRVEADNNFHKRFSLIIDMDDIAKKRDTLRSNLYNEPIEIVLEFPKGDKIYGHPVVYTMEMI